MDIFEVEQKERLSREDGTSDRIVDLTETPSSP